MKLTTPVVLILSLLGLVSFSTIESTSLAASLSGSTASAIAPLAQEEFRWQGRLASGRVIEVVGVNGDVRAEATTGDEVAVRAIKSGEPSDFDRVDIQVLDREDGVTIKAVYPRGKSPRVRVDFTVQVPSGVRFFGHTVNGEVEAKSLSSEVKASTVNGDVHLSTGGFAEASTVNGSINASLGSANWEGTLEFETVNGSLTIHLPDGVNTEVQAETVNGSISTDFPITIHGHIKKSNLRGTIGSGGRTLKLETVNGSIQLRRA